VDAELSTTWSPATYATRIRLEQVENLKYLGVVFTIARPEVAKHYLFQNSTKKNAKHEKSIANLTKNLQPKQSKWNISI